MDKALEGKFQEAVDIWTGMQEPGARIYFNIASMHILLGNLEEAETVRDRYCNHLWVEVLGQLRYRVPGLGLGLGLGRARAVWLDRAMAMARLG